MRKTYLVVDLTETDGDPRIRRMTAKQIREEAGKVNISDFAVIDGKIIKNFESEKLPKD